jgi:hypothetical protein
MEEMRQDIGDTARGVEGRNVRPVGRVEEGVCLTEYDPTHPYIMAEYDLSERG